MNALVAISRELSARVDALSFPSVPFVYNPLDYARAPHEAYLERWGRRAPREVLMVGMNPGPFGMAQTGVPFGEVGHVRDWLGICTKVDAPERVHPKRPIEGFACKRSEVSGARLWGALAERYGTPDRFFAEHFIANYCPLVFMEQSGKNFTPDKLRADERAQLYAACDRHLQALVRVLEPQWVIGVGKFTEVRAQQALEGMGVRIGTILHPSPASPLANKGWAEQADKQLRALGLRL
jgi:single-strand selective monofunctional uracil DNA glycosylase